MITLHDVVRRVGEGDPFRFSLNIPAGESLGVIGPSGAGKSTLLHIIAGFVRLDGGRLLLDGIDHSDTEPAARPVSMVFQANNLFDHLDVATNVGLGIDPRFRRRGEALMRVEDALDQVGLSGFAGRRPASLSGGEAQRVALARALVRARPILLLDEPFAALGPSMRQTFTGLLARMQRERGLTMLTVSHAPTELMGLCDRMAFINARTIAAIGPTEAMLTNPPDPALAAYLGR